MPVLVKLTHYHFARWRPKCIVTLVSFWRRHIYRPRFFEGRIMTPDEQERLYKRLCGFERMRPLF